MLALKDIRAWVASLGVAEDANVYIGKLDNKKPESIGVYGRGSSGQPGIALGGLDCMSYETRPISLLVHWTKDKAASEDAAYALFEKLRSITSLSISNTHISYLRLMVPEPQDVGTDDNGVFEYVIWLDFARAVLLTFTYIAPFVLIDKYPSADEPSIQQAALFCSPLYAFGNPDPT